MIKEIFQKYLRKKPVQQGVISQIIKSSILGITYANPEIKCNYRNEIIYVSNISHEDKIQIFLKKNNIIYHAQKKLLEDFNISCEIKDIRVGN